VVAVESVEFVDRVLRPRPDKEQGQVRPRGTILLAGTDRGGSGLAAALLGRGVRITTSRCGDFHQAIPALESLTRAGVNLGAIVTDRMPVRELAAAFALAVSPETIKVVVTHGDR
jgi:threonine dehydrogenase-like Zn-dependent dehydrogenase